MDIAIERDWKNWKHNINLFLDPSIIDYNILLLHH